MSEGDDIQEVLRVRIVADALTGGDLDALIELSDALEATGTPEKIRTFVLQLLFELLPDTARDKMAAAGEIEGHSNVIDFFTPKQHGKHTQIGCGAHHGFRCVRGCECSIGRWTRRLCWCLLGRGVGIVVDGQCSCRGTVRYLHLH